MIYQQEFRSLYKNLHENGLHLLHDFKANALMHTDNKNLSEKDKTKIGVAKVYSDGNIHMEKAIHSFVADKQAQGKKVVHLGSSVYIEGKPHTKNALHTAAREYVNQSEMTSLKQDLQDSVPDTPQINSTIKQHFSEVQQAKQQQLKQQEQMNQNADQKIHIKTSRKNTSNSFLKKSSKATVAVGASILLAAGSVSLKDNDTTMLAIEKHKQILEQQLKCRSAKNQDACKATKNLTKNRSS
jgi:hypothetical protein